MLKNIALLDVNVNKDIQELQEAAPSFFSSLVDSIVAFLPKLVIAIAIFVLGWYLAKLLTNFIVKCIERSKVDPAAVYFFKSLILVTLRIFVIAVSLSKLGVNVGAIATALGAATVTVGLALQDTLGNVASGILLIFTHPFKEGDYLKIGQDEGTVTKISLFSTHMNTADNKEIVIPNRNVTSESVINYSSNEERRVDLTFNIAYDNDILATKQIIRDILDNDTKVLHEKEPVIGVFSQNDRCLTIDVKFWCKTEEYWELYYKIEEKIKIAFDNNGIKAPYQIIKNKQ